MSVDPRASVTSQQDGQIGRRRSRQKIGAERTSVPGGLAQDAKILVARRAGRSSDRPAVRLEKVRRALYARAVELRTVRRIASDSRLRRAHGSICTLGRSALTRLLLYEADEMNSFSRRKTLRRTDCGLTQLANSVGPKTERI